MDWFRFNRLIENDKTSNVPYKKAAGLLLFCLISLPAHSSQTQESPENLPPSVEAYCNAYPGGTPYNEMKRRVLGGVKEHLLSLAEKAEKRIDDAVDCYNSHRSQLVCRKFRKNLKNMVTKRLEAIKILESIGDLDHYKLAYLSRNAIFNIAKTGEFPPSLIANFHAKGLHYSNDDKELTKQFWRRMAIRSINREIEIQKIEPNLQSCNEFKFNPASHITKNIAKGARNTVALFAELNPLLEVLRYQTISDENIEMGLKKLKAYNQALRKLVSEMVSQHVDSVPSRFNLAISDHEMALVNFPQMALTTIQSLPEKERPNACKAWERLEKQQTQRINSSIGVGFGTALLCGAGIISGFGTVPALVSCLPSMADGLWGGYRGFQDAKTARLSGLSGVEIGLDTRMSGGIRSKEEADHLRRQGNLVMFINIAGIGPVAAGIKSASLGVKGTFKGFAKIPISDSSVSMLEIQSGTIASVLNSLRDDTAPPLEQMPSLDRVTGFKNQCDQIFAGGGDQSTK